MKGCVRIIDFYLNQLSNSKPSPELITILNSLVDYLKASNYPILELVDIISIQIMLEYILSSNKLIILHDDFIKNAISIINDILGTSVYVKIDLRLVALEDDFYKNICISQRQFENRITEEIRQLLIHDWASAKNEFFILNFL